MPFPLWLSQHLLWACQSVLFSCHSEDWGQCHKHDKGTWTVCRLSRQRERDIVYSFTVSVKNCNQSYFGRRSREDFSVHGCIEWNEDCQVKIMQDREFQSGTWHSRYQILMFLERHESQKYIQVRKNEIVGHSKNWCSTESLFSFQNAKETTRPWGQRSSLNLLCVWILFCFCGFIFRRMLIYVLPGRVSEYLKMT